MDNKVSIAERLKSPAVWISMGSLIIFILKTYTKEDTSQYNVVLDMIITVLIGMGILNNPTDKQGF